MSLSKLHVFSVGVGAFIGAATVAFIHRLRRPVADPSTQEETASVDTTLDKKQKFEARLKSIIKSACLNYAISIGHRCKLFDALYSFTGRSFNSQDIANECNGSERYIREWLCVLATSHVIDLSGVGDTPKTQRYTFPLEHARVLASAAQEQKGGIPMSIFCHECDMAFSSVYDHMPSRIIGDQKGQGIPYSAYEEFHGLMTEMSTAKHQKVMIKNIQKGFPDMAIKLSQGVRVLDVGCGSGVALRLLAKEFPQSQFVGVDISEEGILEGRKEAAALGLHNLTLCVGDATNMVNACYANGETTKEASFDWVTAHDAVHDQSQPAAVLQNVYRLLKPGGVFSMIDLAAETPVAGNMDMKHGYGPFLYTLSMTHCMAVGLNNNGTGLGNMWGRQLAVQMLQEAGFRAADISIHHPPGDNFNYEYRCTK